MKDEYKTKKQLISELEDVRRVIVGLRASESEHKQVVVDLEKVQQRLYTIFESVSDGVAVTDTELRITDINEAGLHMFGYNYKGEIIGRSGLELISPEDHARAMVDMRSTLKKDTAVH